MREDVLTRPGASDDVKRQEAIMSRVSDCSTNTNYSSTTQKVLA